MQMVEARSKLVGMWISEELSAKYRQLWLKSQLERRRRVSWNEGPGGKVKTGMVPEVPARACCCYQV